MTAAARSHRAEKVREAHETLEEHIRLLADQMSRGKSEALVRYLEFTAQFHHYSFSNGLLIWSQFPTATRAAGLRQWNRLGRHVRAGEKGIMILAPIAVRLRCTEDEVVEASISDTNTKKRPEAVTRFKPVYVFDVSQTDGKKLPSLLHASGDASTCLPLLQEAVRLSGIDLQIAESVPGAASAHGASYDGRIVIRSLLDSPEAFRTLAHEFAHELLHWPKDGSPKEPDRTIRETEADAAAFVVCRHFGIACDSADYLLLYDSEPKLLLERLETIRRTAAQIIDAIGAAQGDSESETDQEI